ncbi:hypothetical protein D9615_005202 [Tricholomella constricta]|uniref:Copper acquisition factor BIM1-like domain-containing protein n=1 Tax=Tricholomella constricta TaxID=117010 RepID=A0A8H5H5X4_9AGAR|nr:hypothetical protein D9615_005202 [Tricholomella constricta]
MQRYLALLVLALAAIVNAHFQLQFPPPRGVFVEDDEPKFCDGYDTPASNRSMFPLSGGFFTLNSEHPQWTSGVIVAASENPTSFDNFTQVVPFFQTEGEGLFCIPLDFASSANSTVFKDGQNVTVQIVFDGGDGNLYQCADLTLSSSFKISSDVKCSNATGSASTVESSPASTAESSPASTAGSSPTSTAGSVPTSTSAGAPASTQSAGAVGRAISTGVTGLLLSIWSIAFLTL